MKRIILLIAFLAMAAQSAFAIDYFVAPLDHLTTPGNDGFSCALAQNHTSPKRNIQSGINCLQPGDVLHIKAGTYSTFNLTGIPSGPSVLLPTTIRNYEEDSIAIVAPAEAVHSSRVMSLEGEDNVRLLGNGANSRAGIIKFRMSCNNDCGVVLDADQDPNDSVSTVSLVIDGIVMEGARSSPMFLKGPGHIVRNSWLRNSGETDLHHGLYQCATGLIVEDSVFENVFGYGIAQYNSGIGTGTDICDNNIYRRLIFRRNGSAGMLIGDGDNIVLENSISIQDGDQDGWTSLVRVLDGTTIRISHNTVYGDGTESCMRLENPSGVVTRNNICWGNSGGNLIENLNPANGVDDIESNNLASNPLFTNAATEDFTPLAGSLAIDSGFDLTGIVDEDFNGDPRPLGAGFDRGAIETGGPPPDPPDQPEIYMDSECSGDCDSTGLGTFTSPYKTAGESWTHLLPGGTLYARGRATHYTESINCSDAPAGSPTAFTTLRGYPGDALFARFTPTSGVNVLTANNCDSVAFQSLILFGTNTTGDNVNIDSDSTLRFVDVISQDSAGNCWSIAGDGTTVTGGGADTCAANGFLITGSSNILTGGAGDDLDISDAALSGILIEAEVSGGAVTFDSFTASTPVDASGTNSLAGVVVGNNPDRFLKACVNLDSNTSNEISSVTWDVATPQNFTRLAGSYPGGVFIAGECWYLVNPTVGTDSVTINYAGQNVTSINVLSLYNVNQANPIRETITTNHAISGQQEISVASLTTQTGDMAVAFLVAGNPGTESVTAFVATGDDCTAGCTERLDALANGNGQRKALYTLPADETTEQIGGDWSAASSQTTPYIAISFTVASTDLNLTPTDNQINLAVIGGSGGNGITDEGVRTLIQGARIVANGADGIDLSGTDGEAVHNTNYDNVGIGVHISGGSGNLVANNANCLNGTALTDAGAGTTLTTNNSTCDAADFVDPSMFDFNLVAGSDLIDAGTVIPGYPDLDYSGGTRNSGDDPDIGSDELDSTAEIQITSQCFILRPGDSHDIKWICTDCTGDTTITYSVGGGQDRPIAVEANGGGVETTFSWTVNSPATEDMSIKVSNGGNDDEAPATCTVYGSVLIF